MKNSLLCLLMIGFAMGQETPSEARRLRPPALLVRPDPSQPSRPLDVVAASVSIDVLGSLARAEVDLTFRNDTNQILEGNLILPLPDGATVTDYALEIDGVLRRAAVVEKERARVIFEEIVRKNVDPGLVEWVQGNLFRTRIYPIPAKGTRRCVVTYEWEVGGSFVIPVRYGSKLEQFRFRLHSRLGAGKLPAIQSSPFDADGWLITRARGGKGDWKYSTPGDFQEDVVIEVPMDGSPRVVVEKGRDGLTFHAMVPVSIGAADAIPRRYDRVTILYDASNSRTAAARARDIELLERFFQFMKDGVVRLVVFSNDVWFEEEHRVREGKSKPCIQRLNSLVCDGATNLSCLNLSRYGDMILLFSDGMATFGEGLPKPGKAPVHAILSESVADRAVLEKIVAGGKIVDVRVGEADAWLSQLLAPGLRLIKITGEGVVDVEAQKATARNGWFSCVGRLDGLEKTKVSCLFADEAGNVWPADFEIDGTGAVAGKRVDRAWARQKVASLAPFDEHSLEIKEIGLRYGIVTPMTSLLVLETLEDYVRYRVIPPEPLREEYFEIIEGLDREIAEHRSEKLAWLRERWGERVAWYDRDFEVPEGFRYADPEKADRALRGGATLDDDGEGTGAAPGEIAPDTPMTRGGSLSLGSDESEEMKKKAEETGESAGGIAMAPWNPDAPYLPALREAGHGALDVYWRIKADYGNSSAFFLDVADFFLEERNDERTALRVLSNIAELDLGSAPLLRILAHRLSQMGRLDLAEGVFRKVLELRPEEPQSYRDLGLLLVERESYSEAIPLLERVVLGDWDGRFPEIEILTLGELNRAIALCKKKTGESYHTLPDDLIRLLDVDLRVILTWDADNCDMDLWVIEPSGEKAYYGHQQTTIGGHFGNDFTGGYGPEEYFLRKNMNGKYEIKIDYFGNTQQILAGATTIQVDIFKNYGRPNEERASVTRRLGSVKEVLDIAEVEFKKAGD